MVGKEFKCPKPETGVLCFECPKRHICPYLNPPKRRPQLYPPPRLRIPPNYVEFQPLPLEIPKDHYRQLLLIGEDFQLTKPELRDLVYYASKFRPYARKGGRGKSWRKVYAVTCIQILERDRRPIYARRKDYYNSKYRLSRTDLLEISSWVKKEIERINETLFTFRREQSGTETVCSGSGKKERLDVMGGRQKKPGK